MAFSIRLTEGAKQDIAETMNFLARHTPTYLGPWFDGLFEAMESLGEMPARHAIIAESNRLKRPLRALIYHSHRVIYEVKDAEQIVSIVRIYHSSRAPLRPEDLV